MSDEPWRTRLRALPVFSGELPNFDTDAAPTDPIDLLQQWLDLAIRSEASQPHAMTIATVNTAGEPSVRTLLLKDLTLDGLWFATMSNSPKGRDLEANSSAAVQFYWREQGRQIRVTGTVERGDRALSTTDFLARSATARAVAIAGRQSAVQPPLDVVDQTISDARAILDFKPDYVPEEWVAYRIRPHTVEFWQAARQRDQIRLRYTRSGATWERALLWP